MGEADWPWGVARGDPEVSPGVPVLLSVMSCGRSLVRCCAGARDSCHRAMRCRCWAMLVLVQHRCRVMPEPVRRQCQVILVPGDAGAGASAAPVPGDSGAG